MADGRENSERTDADVSERVRTGADASGDFLTTDEAFAFCLERGLSRTRKTLRRACARPADQEGDLRCRKAPAGNGGFRYLIEKQSLGVYVEQQLETERNRRGQAEEDVQQSEAHQRKTDTTQAHQRLDSEVIFLRDQVKVKDEQIRALLERDRETNVLIHGLQNLVLALQPPQRDGASPIGGAGYTIHATEPAPSPGADGPASEEGDIPSSEETQSATPPAADDPSAPDLEADNEH